MSPRTKSTEFPAVRVSPKLKTETEMFAEDAQENLSEYIRKAVEQRNERYRINVDIGNQAIELASKLMCKCGNDTFNASTNKKFARCSKCGTVYNSEGKETQIQGDTKKHGTTIKLK